MNNDEWIRMRSVLEQTSTISNIKKIAVWMALDCPNTPPSAYKQELVKAYSKHYSINTLIETGTYLGDMVAASIGSFAEIHSIELGEELHKNAIRRFRGVKNVKLHQGDSGEVLSSILRKLNKPAIFWLDAHYSEGITAKGQLNTPIIEEVQSILKHKIKNHLILIDDSRIFDGTDDYPTLDKLKKIYTNTLPGASFYNRHDIIRIQPNPDYIEI